jgi:hypothetical protein
MKRKYFFGIAVLLVAVVALGLGIPARTYAATSTTLTFSGTVTISANAPGFTTQTKTIPSTPAVFTQDANGNWNIQMASMSIPWNSTTTVTLQNPATGTLTSASNAVSITLPLQNVPSVNTLTLNLDTNASGGSPVDAQGNLTLVGSQTVAVLFTAHATIQGQLSPWPLPNG